MLDIETITSGVMIATLSASIVGGLPLAIAMTSHAQSHNCTKRQDFLEKELGKNNIYDIHIFPSHYDQIRKNVLLTPIQLHNQSYLLESIHKKSSWLANQFYDTRLYEPINLILKNSGIQNEIL